MMSFLVYVTSYLNFQLCYEMKHSTEPTSLDETCLLIPEQFVEGLWKGNYSFLPGYLA